MSVDIAPLADRPLIGREGVTGRGMCGRNPLMCGRNSLLTLLSYESWVFWGDLGCQNRCFSVKSVICWVLTLPVWIYEVKWVWIEFYGSVYKCNGFHRLNMFDNALVD
ncbi:hypothetical protein J6590_084810 [Homalodisca vitripennis]|nr:hypothetical protein J6590_084810 [Homalodisca vitripennis]